MSAIHGLSDEAAGGVETSLSESDILTSECWILSLVASFVKELFVSEAQNGEVAGSELETEEVPASVMSNGASDSGLQLGVTDGP